MSRTNRTAGQAKKGWQRGAIGQFENLRAVRRNTEIVIRRNIFDSRVDRNPAAVVATPVTRPREILWIS